jgi:hypothetical protein
MQPRSRKTEVAVDGHPRNFKNLCDLLKRKSSEEPHFDDFTLSRMQFCQPPHRIVQCEYEFAIAFRNKKDVFEGNSPAPAASLLSAAAPCVVYQNLTHNPGAHSEEVGSILPGRVLRIDEP